MKKRVLIIAEHDLTSKGGIQQNMQSITTHLVDRYDFDVVVFTDMTEYEKKAFWQYKNIYCVPCDVVDNRIKRIIENVLRPFRIAYVARKLFRENKYSAIHCHDTLKAPLFLLEAKKNNVPIRIMHCHNPSEKDPVGCLKRIYYSFMESLVNPTTNVKIGCSQDACKSTFGVQASKSFVVNNEIDLSRFDPNKFDGVKDNKLNFIHVGRFTHQKNHEFLLNVFRGVYDAFPQSKLTLVGWGVLDKEIREQIDTLGLHDAVTILPPDSNIPLLMSQVNYMIFPSRYEGLGRVLIEAQSMNIMCFASNCIPEETDLGLCDYLDLNSGADSWSRHIVDFISGDVRASREIDKEKQSAFDVNNIIQTYVDIYEGVHCEQ